MVERTQWLLSIEGEDRQARGGIGEEIVAGVAERPRD